MTLPLFLITVSRERSACFELKASPRHRLRITFFNLPFVISDLSQFRQFNVQHSMVVGKSQGRVQVATLGFARSACLAHIEPMMLFQAASLPYPTPSVSIATNSTSGRSAKRGRKGYVNVCHLTHGFKSFYHHSKERIPSFDKYIQAALENTYLDWHRQFSFDL